MTFTLSYQEFQKIQLWENTCRTFIVQTFYRSLFLLVKTEKKKKILKKKFYSKPSGNYSVKYSDMSHLNKQQLKQYATLEYKDTNTKNYNYSYYPSHAPSRAKVWTKC